MTGIVGNNLARYLVTAGDWEVSGISRDAPKGMARVKAFEFEVTDSDVTTQAFSGVAPTHVFFCAWNRQATEAENCRVNGAIVRNVLSAVGRRSSLQHVALVTGTKNQSTELKPHPL